MAVLVFLVYCWKHRNNSNGGICATHCEFKWLNQTILVSKDIKKDDCKSVLFCKNILIECNGISNTFINGFFNESFLKCNSSKVCTV